MPRCLMAKKWKAPPGAELGEESDEEIDVVGEGRGRGGSPAPAATAPGPCPRDPEPTLLYNVSYKVLKKTGKWKKQTDPYSYCLSFKDCRSCVRAELHPCGWCHHYGCSHRPDLFCPEVRRRLLYFNDSCPFIWHKDSKYLHAGTITLSVRIQVPDPGLYHNKVVCVVTFPTKRFMVPGQIIDSAVRCDRFEYSNMNEPHGSVRLLWGGGQPLSNELSLMLFDCGAKGRTCGACKEIPLKYNCGWCERRKKCTARNKCRGKLDKWRRGKDIDCAPTICEHENTIRSFT